MSGEDYVRSKIVCTVGPASSSPEMLGAMVEAGMNVARLNLSHGAEEEHREVIRTLRGIGGVAVLVDVPGPKIRLGEVAGPAVLRKGDEVHFTTEAVVGDRRVLPVNYDKLPAEVRVGGRVFINDGLIEVTVDSIDDDLKGFSGSVVSGGEVSSHKGVNAPGAILSVRPPTEQDLEGIRFGVEEEADWFAASFIRDGRDVENFTRAVRDAGGDQPVISKIEHGEAIQNMDEIIAASDGVMVARGDLGIEVKPWEVPLLQKSIIGKCNAVGKPVIVATQMLESMVLNPRPTRAEASDVANAILDGADAVMLSEETATGLYPLEAVRAMDSLGRAVEEGAPLRRVEGPKGGQRIPDLIGSLAAEAVESVKPAAIIVVTRSGFSALMVSKYRPRTRILAVARDEKVARRMHLFWGVQPLDVPWTEDRNELILRAVTVGLEEGHLERDSVIMLVSGSTLEAPGRTSTLEILNVGDILSHASAKRGGPD